MTESTRSNKATIEPDERDGARTSLGRGTGILPLVLAWAATFATLWLIQKSILAGPMETYVTWLMLGFSAFIATGACVMLWLVRQDKTDLHQESTFLEAT